MPSSRKRIALAIGLGIVTSGLVAAPASANPAGTSLVISEVYGGGGNGGATYTHDFIELYNPTGAAISVAGMSVQYRSTSGTSVGGNITSLSGSVPSGGHYLVQEASNAAVGAALPTPDATGTIAMGAGAGQVLLVNGTGASTVGTGDLAGNPNLVDMVGYGAAGSFEGAATGVALTSTKSAFRNATPLDSDNNANDFAEALPTPEGQGGVTPPPDEFTGTIAEIQGTDTATSPHVGDIATTQGVVTAAYPTGGYNGFYIQTPGTGGANDATPGASDGLFVYGSAATSVVAPGDHVEVVGPVKEYSGTTEIETDAASDVTVLSDVVTAPTPLATTLPATEAAREAHEGEVLAPTGPFTVTNTYSTNQYAEIGLAAGGTPLIAPTEIRDAQDTSGVAEVTADNAARAITLDDGASLNFLSAANQATPLPWLATTNPIRVGAPVTFTGPVVLEYRNNVWKFQPTSQVTGTGEGTATFVNTRTEAPESVGGDIRLATFNVLNYFPTTGQEFVSSGLGTCTYYNDRAANPITNNTCTNNGPRGAANDENFLRQQVKIVTAINKLGASIVSLEELENSVQFGKDRDFAISRLVEALNTAAGSEVWDFAPSPAAADLPAPSEEDVIRTGFIFKPADVDLVGASEVLIDEVNFDNAREPLAQAFKRTGTTDADAFAVIVNHFKSKGSGTDDGTGQGNSNPDRIGQAHALSAFADSFAADRGTDAMFLAGDFNSYSMEDPIQVLEADGYTRIESDTEGEETYSYSGLSGSLDHMFANDAGLALVTGADVWNINSGEALAFEYSRYNYNVNSFYQENQFRASDHDPEIVGLDLADAPAPVDVQILGTNDFHGRLANNPTGTEAGAAVMAGAVKQLRAANPNTVFAAAGDLIGASTFESFIQDDKPTIDALNEAGLDVSAVGNHEFDKGYDDLLNRVMADYDATTNPRGGAEWQYIGANVRMKATGNPAVPATWVKDFGDVEVGFVGAVTEHLDELVSPGGIADIEVTDIVEETNAAANDLKVAGADVVVLLVHEGAPNTNCATMDDDPTSDFGSIITGVNDKVDAIVSGHTHLAYDCSFPVAGWSGRPVTDRPVVSAGQYGANLNKLVFTVDPTTGQVTAKTQQILALKTGQTANYPSDPATAAIVKSAVDEAAVLGAQPLGEIAGEFNRGKLANGTTENRGAESTLGNLVAEVQQWATETPEAGAAQIALMNSGGLRADMTGEGTGAFPRTLTYRQAANVQSFANTLVNMQLTGANLKLALEQQWQPAGSSRPFLRLGASEGFTHTFDPARAVGDRITGMWLNGEPIAMGQTYSVTVNSFLSTGGDNFGAFNNGTQKRDTGKVDLEAMVDYMAEFADPAEDEPLPVDYSQRAVGVSFPAGAPAVYQRGSVVAFDVSSWAFTTAADAKDTEVVVSMNGQQLGAFPLDNAAPAALPGFDDQGKASVSVTVPQNAPSGAAVLTLTGVTTGTTTKVPVQVAPPVVTPSSVAATATPMKYGTDGTVAVTVTPATATGTVQVLDGDVVLGQGTLSGGSANVTIPGDALEPGSHNLTVRYNGDAQTGPSTGQVTVQVAKADSETSATASPTSVEANKGTASIAVSVSADGVTPTGTVEAYVDGALVDSATLAAGEASLEIGPFDTVGTESVEIRYAGDDRVAGSSDTVPVEVTKADSVTSANVSPETVRVKKGTARVDVNVSADGVTPTGTVSAYVDGDLVDSATLSGGEARLVVGPFDRTGRQVIKIRYSGDDSVSTSETSVSVRVVKAKSRITVEHPPKKVKAGETNVVLKIRVDADGVTPKGTVTIESAGKDDITVELEDGRARVRLPEFAQPGRKKLTISYDGSDLVEGATATEVLKVVR